MACFGWDIQIDTGPKLCFRSRQIFPCALSLAIDVIGRKSGLRDLVVSTFVLVVQDAVVEAKQIFLGHIAVLGLTNAVDISCQALAGNVVVHDDLQEVRYRRNSLQVLFGAINGAERIGMPDVPADAHIGLNGFHFGVHRCISVT
jgi:hypothetical protein